MTARRIAGVLCAALVVAAVPAASPAARAVAGGPARSGPAPAPEDAAGPARSGPAPAPEEPAGPAHRGAGLGGPAAGEAGPRPHGRPEIRWRDLLARSVSSARERSFAGETVWVTRTPEGPKSSVVEVRGGAGRLRVGPAGRRTLRLGDLGGDVVHHEQGWFSSLPAADRDDLDGALDALAGKYRVETGGDARVLDRPCHRLDIYRRSDDRLAERLWLDAATGLLLRRETFDSSGRLLRLATFRRLDLSPVGRSGGERPSKAGGSLERRAHEVEPVGDRRLAALEKAGYVVPEDLPDGYERIGVYASVSAGGASLQAVYRDGLYTVSVFQQRGRPDWSRLPEGREPAAHVDWPAYEWPGAVPHRLIWESSGTTFLLVGDAPPDDQAALAGAFPRPQPQRPLARLRRGLGRLWAAMSPWE